MTRKKHKKRKTNFSGQHFMHNKKLIDEIVGKANISKQDTVIDIGAGKGALTSVLSQRSGQVLAVEYDRKLVEILKRTFHHHPNTKIIHQDMLKMKLPKEPFIVVSNIPYAITTPIMKMLLNKPASSFQRGVIVMEKGAAKRFTAKWVKDPYVITWRMWFDIKYVKEISRKNFSPPPKVDSAMITINRKAEPIVPIAEYALFWGLAAYALKNPQSPIDFALRGIFTIPQLKHLKRNMRINSAVPVAGLSEHQWGIIFEAMVKHVPRFRWPKIRKGMFIRF